jgi:nicotinamidase-related amidase
VVPVPLPSELVGWLDELGGSVEDHVVEAIKRYLESFEAQHEEISAENDEQNDDEDKDIDEQDKGEHVDGGSEGDDEDEYFNPDDYE